MRYLVAAILTMALGSPAAVALPTERPHSVSASHKAKIEQASNRKQTRPHGHSRNLGGIHPLVGSGDY